jgi:glyoxylase-like metal-dependent hydrolase (beta-lactamase superfamily II)
MAEWGRGTVVREIPAGPVRIAQILRFGKGCLSYLLAIGRDAVIVDPHRRAEDYQRLLHEQGLTLRGVFDTHLHADHISGGATLAESASVPYFGHRADFEGTAHAMSQVLDRGRMRLGAIEIQPLVFLHGPGHTPGSTALLVDDRALLSGDTLFVESVGRPDLAGKAAEWGSDLYRTLHDRFSSLPDGTLVLPAHSGSPREARPDGSVAATLGALRRGSDSLRLDEAAFVSWVSGTTSPAPANYDRIREVNLGRAAAGEDEQVTMELGRNECAVARPAGR